jgi:predicted GNAT family N-acyltransferase
LIDKLKIVKFVTDNEKLTEKALSIRRIIFVEEQEVPPELEYESEEESTHYLVYLNEMPIATARWRKTEAGIKLERFATLKEFRNKGVGSALMKKILEDILPFKQEIYLNSQLKAVPLYERHGFVIEGPMFYEAGMAHYKMKYKPLQ